MSTEEPRSNPWTVLCREVKHESSHFKAREDVVSFRGQPQRLYCSIRVKFHGVCIAPIDRDGFVTLVGQYRYVQDRYTWELPGGGVLVGDDPLEAAKAELGEETGLEAARWLKVVDGSASIGTSDECQPGYVAWDLRQGRPRPDDEEELTLRRMPFEEALEMALRGEIGHLVGSALLFSIDTRLRRQELPHELEVALRRGYRS